jgi:hypothetical protein
LSEIEPPWILRLDLELLRFHDRLSLPRRDEPMEDGVGGSSGLENGGGDLGAWPAADAEVGIGSMYDVTPPVIIVLTDSSGANALEGVGAGARGPEGLRIVDDEAEGGMGGGIGVTKEEGVV